MAEEFTDIEDFDISCHSEIQQDFSDPDFSENGTDYWEHYRFEVEKGQVLLRIDKYLVERIKGTSRNRIQNAAEAQCIRVNGKPVKSNYRVHPGEIITVYRNLASQKWTTLPDEQWMRSLTHAVEQRVAVDAPAAVGAGQLARGLPAEAVEDFNGHESAPLLGRMGFC